MIDPLYNINSDLYKTLGQADVMMKREVILRIYGVTAMLIGASHSVIGLCLAGMSTSIVAFLLSCIFTSRICELSFRQQLSDFLPYSFMAILANIPAYVVNTTNLPPLLALTIGGFFSFSLYILLLFIRKDTAGSYLYGMLKNKLGHRLRFLP